MIIQWIIVSVAVAAAAFYIGRMIVRAVKHRGCAGCAEMPKTMKLLKKLEKNNERKTR